MIRFFGQPKYRYPQSDELIGYELLLREWQNGRWGVPTDFSQYSATDITELLRITLGALPATLPLISFNLDQAQFADAQFLRELTALAGELLHPEHLVVELTERDEHVASERLSQAAKQYADSGLRVCLDDVGTGANQAAMAMALLPYTVEYKFALQNFRTDDNMQVPLALLRQWHDRAVAEGKLFAIEGLEAPEDLAIADAYAPNVLQGYYFGHPALLATTA
ncbi:EAL domain-containing protein [Lacticaseibacillus sp. GG6-2]